LSVWNHISPWPSVPTHHPPRRWLASPVFTKTLHPPDRRTAADLKLFGCLHLFIYFMSIVIF
jgi:hypothetical protein